MKRNQYTVTLALIGLLLVSSLPALSQVVALSTRHYNLQSLSYPQSSERIHWSEIILIHVYTVPQINERVTSINTAIEDHNQLIIKNTTATDSLEEKIQKTESHFNDLIKESIDKLPQRLLSEEAKNILKEAVLAELRIELTTLRLDLQRQIDEIKAEK